MRPPLDVPKAPPRSSTDSSAMPWARMAVLSDAVLTPGSPEAKQGSGSASPSVCSTSYLGIRQAGHGNTALVAPGDILRGPNSRWWWRVLSTMGRVSSNSWSVQEAESSGKLCGVNREPSADMTFSQSGSP